MCAGSNPAALRGVATLYALYELGRSLRIGRRQTSETLAFRRGIPPYKHFEHPEDVTLIREPPLYLIAMAQDNGVTVQAVAQGRCTECDSHSDNYTVEKREFDMDWGIERMLSCECGARAVVTITDDGLLTEGSVTHEDASWN